VALSESRAYVTYAGRGDWDDLELAVLDITDPANCVWVAEYDDAGVYSLAVCRNHLFATSGPRSRSHVLSVFDLSDPAANLEEWDSSFAVRQDIGWPAPDVALANGRIYVAAGPAGLIVLPTIANVQFTVRVEATPGTPFTVEAATDLSAPNPWSPLVTTNISVMPFDCVDYDVKVSDKPRKFYRVRQP
jgi:hypothetical protein